MSHDFPRVLLLDVFEDEGEMYARYLRTVGFDVQVYRWPIHAFAAIAARAPDVIVTRLPQAGPVDGIEFTRRLRLREGTAGVPVVMITSSMLPADRDAALAAGSDAYLVLPMLPDQLEAAIRRVLSVPRSGDSGGA